MKNLSMTTSPVAEYSKLHMEKGRQYSVYIDLPRIPCLTKSWR